MTSFDVEKIRKDFPILRTRMGGRPLAYLDNAATSQKPTAVIDAVSEFYSRHYSNIHRGIYELSEKATEMYVHSKGTLAGFINAGSYREIVYLRNATEAINLAAMSWGGANVGKGDHILISEMEHHSNIVPWQMLAKRKRAVLDYISIDRDGLIDIGSYREQLEKGPKIVAVTHVSNVLGTVNDVKRIAGMAHSSGAAVLIDGAQSAPHMRVDVRECGADFFALSSHKMLGPSGIGALYAREEILESMEPIFGGGEMIKTVGRNSSTWDDPPWRFEAGTQNIEGAIGMEAAIGYLKTIGMGKVQAYEKELTRYAMRRLSEIDGLSIAGPSRSMVNERGGIISFSLRGIHPHDVAQVFDSEGIAIRSGHHCAMPLVRGILKEAALSRISMYIYNTTHEIDRAVDAIYKAKKLFS